MPLSLTCSCGALLEIDDKFAGQVVRCPDCNLPLDTAPSVRQPSQTSGFALASLLLALVGVFTLIGTIAAIVCGMVGLKQIRRAPEQLGGKRFAQAGIALGVAGTLATLALLSNADIFRLDGLLRALELAGNIDFMPDEVVPIERSGAFDPAHAGTIKRPSAAWGRLTYTDPNRDKIDDLVLANVWEDAYIICLSQWLEGNGQSLEDCRQEGLRRFLQSELITKFLGRASAQEPRAGQEHERRQLPGTETQEFFFDMPLGGRDWTFLIRILRDGNRLNIVAGGTRQHRFARLQGDIVKALDSYKLEK
jgi:Domain of unknown function (DUF4190)